jgi:hypothetical protein
LERVVLVVPWTVSSNHDPISVAADRIGAPVVGVGLAIRRHEVIDDHETGVRSPYESDIERVALVPGGCCKRAHSHVSIVRDAAYGAEIVEILVAVLGEDREPIAKGPNKW